MRSLEILIDLILPSALWPLGGLNFLKKWEPGIIPGGKGGPCVGLISPPLCAYCLQILGASTSCSPQGLSRSL